MTLDRIDPSPLDSFPVVRSRIPEEVQDAIVRTYGARKLNFAQRSPQLNVKANHWQSRNIALSYCNYGGSVCVEFPEARFFRLQIAIRGAADILIGRIRRRVSSSETSIIPPETTLTNQFPPGYDQIVVRVDASALFRTLNATFGGAPYGQLVFDSVTPVDRLAGLRRILQFFINELDSLGSKMPGLVLTELEQSVIVSFLCSNPNNYSALLEGEPPRAATWQVRRAEEYIKAHWDKPITIEELSRETATSARSLFYHFKKSRGRSPMDFLKEVRLDHARDMLTKCDSIPSVTETAFACGFGNMGHFAKHYLSRFGERPSDTLRRERERKNRLV